MVKSYNFSSYSALCAFGEEYDDQAAFGHYYSFSYDPKLAMAISVGGESGCHSATDLNEDSIAMIKSDINDYSLAIIADGHFGNHSSKIAINTIISAFKDIPQDVPLTLELFKSWLVPVLLSANNSILKKNMNQELNHKSETTLSLVLANTSGLYWANFGDSRIYTTWAVENHYDIAPIAHRVFLGRQMSEVYLYDNLYAGFVSWQTTTDNKVLPCVIICSDGFPEVRTPDIDPSELITWVGYPSNGEEACKNLMLQAFAHNACDNLTCAVIISPKIKLS